MCIHCEHGIEVAQREFTVLCFYVVLRSYVQFECFDAEGNGTKTTNVMWELPPLHAPFKNCNPHPDAKKLTRQLTVDTLGEKDRPDIQNMRALANKLYERFQHLCNGEEKATVGTLMSQLPTQAFVPPPHNLAFPPPPLPPQASVGMPSLLHYQVFGIVDGKENIPPDGM